MPRKSIIRTSEFPYHVTIRTNNKDWFDLPLKEVWSLCLTNLKTASSKVNVNIQSFVLMNNHYHLLIWTPNCDLDKFMYYFNSGLSKGVRKSTGRINRIFGDRYHWSLIKDQNYYELVQKYIYRNPIRAGLVRVCEEYEFSSLHYIFKKKDIGFTLYNENNSNNQKFLQWINDLEIFPSEFSKALKKPIFKYPISRTSRRKA